ncbi:hypothetical protein QO034_10560 [Sedimentitalea sp. JM2-8]|uniref:Restriction endonuclease n=1 Tax=Sedimentitalea xiamensis TaxID=3050037 RepID=A0ABT7FEK5_9RHOB|nr:hypothetical protein [Sedimentitalea xiamensis]MDK3073554.1 hypothetical protein [Sedimentitalea xiamensis]
MSDDSAAHPIVRPIHILAGLGTLERAEICQIIALLECVDGLFLAKGAVAGMTAKLGLETDATAERLQAVQNDLARSSATDAALRFRLWSRLTEAMALPLVAPLSTKSATRSASAFAVRVSERLTPSIRARHRRAHRKEPDGGIAELIGGKAADYWNSAKAAMVAEPSLPFPQIVAEEMLALLSNDEVVKAAAKGADPKIAEALRQGQARARNAMGASVTWASLAALVANAGFLPYMLAAQLSAVIPLVSGPALVSLLATLVNPVTVFVGVAALGWLGMGRGSRVVRSQLAARLAVLMAAQGTQRGETGLDRFLADMRKLDREPTGSFDWMPVKDRVDMRRRVATLTGRLAGPLPAPAGRPPEPWSSKKVTSDFPDALAVLSLTAGEMLWHAAAIDPNVMKAADFSRSEDIGDPMAFACNAGDFLTFGAGWSLRGYTAERLVMDKLIADGHDVQLAEASNTPGLDLMVDGTPVQVKCGTALSNLTEHFEKYPDIPVIANATLAEEAVASGAPWAHLVTTIPGFEIAKIEEQVAETLGHAADLADPDILQFALSIGVLRGGIEVARERIPISDLPAWLLLDGASRGLLVFAGGNAGAWFGLIAIGPAGALILGPAIGAAALLGNNTLKGYAQKQLKADWHEELKRDAEELHGSIVAALERRIARLEKRSVIFASNGLQSDLDAWMAQRTQDDLIAALEDRASFSDARPKAEADAIRLLFSAREIAPADAAVLSRIHEVEQKIARKPGLKAAMAEAGRPAGDVLRSRLKGCWFDRRKTEVSDNEP